MGQSSFSGLLYGFEPFRPVFAKEKVTICVLCFSLLSIPCQILSFIGPRKSIALLTIKVDTEALTRYFLAAVHST